MNFQSLAGLLRVLSTPRRLHILHTIMVAEDEQLLASIIASRTGLTEAQAHDNLYKLVDIGLLLRRTSGKWSFYSVNPAALEQLRVFFNQEKP